MTIKFSFKKYPGKVFSTWLSKFSFKKYPSIVFNSFYYSFSTKQYSGTEPVFGLQYSDTDFLMIIFLLGRAHL